MRPLTVALILVTAVSLFPAAAGEALNAATLKVPHGFEVQRADKPAQVKFPMFGAFDDNRRLFVTESSGLDLYEELQKQTRRCRLSVLSDFNQDGVYDDARVFAEKLVFPMGLAWRAGKLYVADPPDLITLEDTDGDGRADKRTVVLTGFGHTDNGSLHGLTFGPGGWLYMTMGQPDGYRIKRADGKLIEGRSGALMRCKPDGSEFEVLCRGFENLVEVVFLPTGEVIGTDNWFFLPQDGVRDALVHLVPGAVYPLNAHAKFESGSFFSGEMLPPITSYPAVAQSGLMLHSGWNLPAGMRGNLFSAQFNTRKVVRHELARSGSTFTSGDEDFLTTDDPDFHPSDVLEDKDGSLIVIDTGSWYVHHCPTGRIRKAPATGGIYRVRYTNELAKVRALSLSEADAAAIQARALGLERDPQHSGELSRLLAHEAAHVRLAAAEALSTSGTSEAVPAIIHALKQKNDSLLTHALVYALHAVAEGAQLERMLTDADPQVRRAALIVLDQAPHEKLSVEHAMAAAKSSDADLRSAGMSALKRHPEWKDASFEIFKEIIEQKAITREDAAALRDWITFFPANVPVAELVDEAARDRQKDVSSRVLLIELLPRLSGDGSPSPALRAAITSNEKTLVSAALRSMRLESIRALGPELAAVTRSGAPLGTRLEAIRLLVRGEGSISPEQFEILRAALAPNNAPGLRLSAAETLGNAELNSRELQLFIEHARKDRMISPMLVLSATERCRDAKAVAESLASYLHEVVASGWQVPEATMKKLEQTLGATHLELLARSADAKSADRAGELQRLERLLGAGDPNRGQQLFIGKLACATCHRVGRHGGLVGPDLTKLGMIRSGRDIIESLAMPSATLAQGYESYRVMLKDGEVLTGMRIKGASEEFVLRDSSGAERRLEPGEIELAEPQPNSLMPEGLLNGLEKQEIADLLAYLQSLK